MSMLYNSPKAAYDHDVYEWRKAHHICVKCGHETVKKGHTRCFDCLEKQREYNKHREPLTTEQRYNKYLHNKRKQDLLAAFRVCLRCHTHNAAQGHALCTECLLKLRRKSEDQRRRAGIYPHDSYSDMCKFCGKNPPIDGKKLCKECYEKAMRNLSKANAARNNKITFGKKAALLHLITVKRRCGNEPISKMLGVHSRS